METRPLGTTGHESSVLTLGSVALAHAEQERATDLVTEAIDRGVNHVDVAPTYGDAESKLAPTLAERRDEVFLACKTTERSYDAAREELEASMDRLGVDHLDLYQFHAVTTREGFETILGEGDDPGALAAFRDACEEGLIDHLGLTSHGHPDLIEEAVERIDDLATVMFPLNHVTAAKEDADHDYERVLATAEAADLGTLGIKAFARGPWPDDLPEDERPYHTWYEPFSDPEMLEASLRYALSQGLTTITNAGDPDLLPAILDAAEAFEPMDGAEQAALLAASRDRDSPVPTGTD